MPNKLNSVKDLIVIRPSEEAIKNGVDYASRSLHWTFNRMMIMDGPWTWYYRMTKISMGVMMQETLATIVKDHGLKFEKDWSDYRTEDTFDIQIGGKQIDLKSFSIYSDGVSARLPFSYQLIVDNKDYPGPDWRHFFPLLVPRDQFKTGKDAYIFGYTKSPNYVSNKLSKRDKHFIISAPIKEWSWFLGNKKMVLAREANDGYIDVSISLAGTAGLTFKSIELIIGIEKDGGFTEVKGTLKQGSKIELDDISGLCYIRVTPDDHKNYSGDFILRVTKNNLKEPVFHGKGLTDVNIIPPKYYTFRHDSFADLMPPQPLEIILLGWISKEEYKYATSTLPCYAYPLDRKDPDINQSGTPDIPGFMYKKACCYVYPNIGSQYGGLKEMNHYVLPGHLNTMKSIGDIVN